MIKYFFFWLNIFNDIIGIYDSNYQEIVKYTYDNLGKIISIVDNSINNIGTINPFRYRSYYYDEESGLYYLNSRYYNPLWGRFINADTMICGNNDIESANLYAYVSNNFINGVDPSGHSAFKTLSYVSNQTIGLMFEKKNKNTSSKNIEGDNKILYSVGGPKDIPRFGPPYSHEFSPDGTKERWRDADGNPFKDRHYTNHGNAKRHPIVPHDQYWKKLPNGEWSLPSEAYEPRDDDIPKPDTEKIATGVIFASAIYIGYLGVKWAVAIAATPVTGGASLGVAAATP